MKKKVICIIVILLFLVCVLSLVILQQRKAQEEGNTTLNDLQKVKAVKKDEGQEFVSWDERQQEWEVYKCSICGKKFAHNYVFEFAIEEKPSFYFCYDCLWKMIKHGIDSYKKEEKK